MELDGTNSFAQGPFGSELVSRRLRYKRLLSLRRFRVMVASAPAQGVILHTMERA